MINRRRFLQRLVGGTATLLMAPGCSSARTTPTATQLSTTQPTATMSAATAPARLRVGFSNVPKQMNPALYSVLEEFQLGFAIFDGLVWVDEDLIPQPLLAAAWETSRNFLQWTFSLQEGVTFHHGTLFTAADVVHTFTRLLDPNFGAAFRNVLRFVNHVEAVDDYTVRFILNSPNSELPLLLSSPQASIVARDYADKLMTRSPSGTGPFRFAEVIPGDRIRLVRNDTYWGTSGHYIDEVEYLYGSYAEQLQALVHGQLDVISQLGADDISRFQDDPAVQVITAPSGAYQTVVMQMTEKPFDDPRVRKAFKYAVDHAALQATVLQDYGLVGNNHPVTPISPFWNDLPKQTQDLAQARALLAQAGYPKGLQLDLITSTSRPGMLELALAVREMVKPAGIQIQVVRVPADVYWTEYSGKIPFHIGSWGFRPSIDETFMVAYHSTSKGNESKWSSPVLDDLIDRARGEQDEANRKALYAEAQKLIAEEGAVIIPYFRPVAIALRRNVQGFILHPAGWLDFSTVEIGDEA